MRPAVLSLVGLLALRATTAHAQAPAPPVEGGRLPDGTATPRINYSVELELGFARGATCPKPAYLHQEVTRRLGYDPFLPDPDREPAGRFRATLGVAANGNFATVLERFDIDGMLASSRPYQDNGGSWLACQGLMKEVAVEIADQLTFLAVIAARRAMAEEARREEAARKEEAEEARKEEPAPKPAAPAPAPTPPLPPPLPSRSLHPRVEVGLAGFGSFGTGPHPTLGGAFHAGLSITPFGTDRTRLVFAVEFRTDTPAIDVNGVHTQLVAGSLIVCGSADVVPGATVTFGFLGCLLGTAGALRTSGQSTDGYPAKSNAYAAVGARFGPEVRFARLVLVLPQIEILATVGYPNLGRLRDDLSVGTVTANVGVAAAFLF